MTNPTRYELREKLVFPHEYSLGIREDIDSAYERLRDLQPTPTSRRDSYRVLSDKIFSAIGVLGLELTTHQARCPITDTLVPTKATLKVHDSLLGMAVEYSYDSRRHFDTWLVRPANLSIDKATPKTPRAVALSVARSLKTTTGLTGATLNPNPDTKILIDEIIEFADENYDTHRREATHTVPLPTKSTLADGRNDATASLTTKSLNGIDHHHAVDVASLYRMENYGVMRVASVEDKIFPRVKINPLVGSLALHSTNREVSRARRTLEHEAAMGDPWPLFHELHSGLEAIRRFY